MAPTMSGHLHPNQFQLCYPVPGLDQCPGYGQEVHSTRYESIEVNELVRNPTVSADTAGDFAGCVVTWHSVAVAVEGVPRPRWLSIQCRKAAVYLAKPPACRPDPQAVCGLNGIAGGFLAGATSLLWY